MAEQAPETASFHPGMDIGQTARPRLDSVDLLRGIIMVFMSLDHVRDFLTHLRFAPEDFAHTWGFLFFTRWLTHFSAPTFFFLAGTGAYLSAMRGRSPQDLRHFLWTRGLWLVLLELTLIDFLWTFTPGWSYGGVIWALGWSMVLMSFIVRLPMRWIAGLGLGMIFLHNLLDPIRPENLGRWGYLWGLLHAPNFIPIAPKLGMWFDLYVLVPWVGVMAAGFALGALYKLPSQQRQQMLLRMGLAAVVLFVVLRATNFYGNPSGNAVFVSPGDFHVQPTLEKTVILFLDVEKYPPSLQFLLMTLGPGLVALSLFERINMAARTALAAAARAFVVFGRVPMFYYCTHILLAHLMAVAIAPLFGQPAGSRFIGGFLFSAPAPGYGHNLGFIWLAWAVLNVALYFPCRWFAEYKRTHRQWWLSYI